MSQPTTQPSAPALARLTRIVQHLEQLPLELHEPILANLTFLDIILLDKHASFLDNSRLQAAMSISPAWRDVWPIYTKHRDDFQALASLTAVPIGAHDASGDPRKMRLFSDPTGGILKTTPGQIHRRLERERQQEYAYPTEADKYDLFTAAVRRASDFIQTLLRHSTKEVLDFVHDVVLKREPLLMDTPWKVVDDDKSYNNNQQELPAQQKVYCHVCNRWEDLKYVHVCSYVHRHDPTQESPKKHYYFCTSCRYHYRGFEALLFSPPGDFYHPVHLVWMVPQIKAFVDAYATAQTRLNQIKSAQLLRLANLYSTHHSRLKSPLAPRDLHHLYAPLGETEHNKEHLPQQLERTSGHVLRIVDLDPVASARRKKQGLSLFTWPHASLVPYDWCLRLWFRITEEVEPGLLSSGPGTTTDSNSPPEQIKTAILKANEGLRGYFRRAAANYNDQEPLISQRITTTIPTPASVNDTQPPDSTNAIFAIRKHQSRENGSPLRHLDDHPFRHCRCLKGDGHCTSRNVILPPIDPDEMDWLEAFVSAVEWMEARYPDIAAECKRQRIEDELPKKEKVRVSINQRRKDRKREYEEGVVEEEEIYGKWDASSVMWNKVFEGGGRVGIRG